MVTQTLCVERHVSVTVQTEAAALGESIQRLLPNTRDVAMNLMRSQLLETVWQKIDRFGLLHDRCEVMT